MFKSILFNAVAVSSMAKYVMDHADNRNDSYLYVALFSASIGLVYSYEYFFELENLKRKKRYESLFSLASGAPVNKNKGTSPSLSE